MNSNDSGMRASLFFALLMLAAFGCGGTTGETGTDAGAQGDGADTTVVPACELPNPRRAVVSEDLLHPVDISIDGSFELDTADVQIFDHPQGRFELPTTERSHDAAHTGDWGYLLEAAPGEAAQFMFRGNVDKGEEIEFSFWARSLGDPLEVRLAVIWERGIEIVGNPAVGPETTVGSEWTQVSYTTSTTDGVQTALFGLAVNQNTGLHVDDFSIGVPTWRMAEYDEGAITVGGIPVPAEPIAPTYFTILIHIEDPSALQLREEYFWAQSAVFERLAEVLHEHGGFLTIQPEEDWIRGAVDSGFDPTMMSDLTTNYGVQYSTHTHGPNCKDDDEVPRSANDCSSNPDWDDAVYDNDILTYVGNLRDLISSAAGIPVTDHNGNFDFREASRFSEINMLTWSAFKNKNTQRTYDYFYNNPWRPTEGNALEDIEPFVTHDPTTGIVYVPGIGSALTTHHENLEVRAAPIVSQFIQHADPNRVNTFYLLTHIGKFYSREDNTEYIAYDAGTGEITYSAEFEAHLSYWDDFLTDVIDPLVEAGYLTWASIPQMGEHYIAWEQACTTAE